MTIEQGARQAASPPEHGTAGRAGALRDPRLRRIGLVVLAAIGASLLLALGTARWATPSDEHAYWLAGRRLLDGLPLYDASAASNTPYAYWYPPIVAQVMAPVAAVLPAIAFTAAWTILLLACLWWMSGRRVLGALAMVAFLPVAIELWFRNVHLVLALLIVLGVTRWPWAFAVGAAIKLAPGLGIVYLAARGRWRDAAFATAVGLVLLAVSVALSPGAWRDFFTVLAARGPTDGASFLPIPYIVRAVAGLVLTLVAARLPARVGDILLVIAITLALPTLWPTALSTLIAIVPIAAWHWSRGEAAGEAGGIRNRAAEGPSLVSVGAPQEAD